MAHERAGTLAQPSDLIDIAELVTAYYTRTPDGSMRYGVHHYRYVWPAECDLMAALAGMSLESRQADWSGSPFTGDSESHVSVWRTPTT